MSLRCSRAVHSASTSRPSRSSKLSSGYWDDWALLGDGLGHPGQFHGVHLFQGLFNEHERGPPRGPPDMNTSSEYFSTIDLRPAT